MNERVADVEQVTVSMDGFEVNSYVVHGAEQDVVVDAGAEPERILAAARHPVAAILVTHNHADHIGALDEVRLRTAAPVYMHPLDAESAGIADYEPLEDEQDLLLAGETFRVVHTPGHSPGHTAFVVGRDVIVGDLILPGSVGRTDIEGASWEDIEVSVRKILPHWRRGTRLYAGHGSVLSASEERAHNPYLPPAS